MSSTLMPPADVKLMNLASGLMVLTFAGLTLGAVVDWVVRQPVFAIRSISVDGDTAHTNALTLRANVSPRLQGGFLSMDLNATRQAFEAVPWVRKAVVRREFPNRLRVTLQEHQAQGFWGNESESRLINSYGEVFEANTGEVDQDDLPRLDGPVEQSAQVLGMYRSLKPVFEQVNLTLDELELSARGGWRAQLDTGAVIELGGGADADVLVRTQQFLTTLTHVVSRYGRTVSAVQSADLRHREGYALRLRGVSTLADDKPKK